MLEFFITHQSRVDGSAHYGFDKDPILDEDDAVPEDEGDHQVHVDVVPRAVQLPGTK